MSRYFVIGDGDHIRRHVDLHLLAEDVDSLRRFSARLVGAVDNIKRRVVEQLDADVVIAGGDDIIFVASKHSIEGGGLVELAKYFKEATGSTISFGVGRSLEVAYLNLRRAKARGGGRIVGLDLLTSEDDG